jgi:alkane 1-monooxygenase
MLSQGIKKIGFLSAFILPALLIIGYYSEGIFLWTIHFFVFIIIPVMDYVVEKDTNNIGKEIVSKVANERYYKWVTFGWVFVQVAVLFWGFYVVSISEMKILGWIAFTSGMALVTGGIGITVAHELGHKPDRLEQLFAKTLLMTVCYMHFFIEHNRGHHVRVATPEDPATSRFGESFYSFWWRSVTLGFLSAWGLENDRLRRRKLPAFSMANQMLVFLGLTILFIILVFLGFSLVQDRWVWEVPVFFIAQSILAFSLLEVVNYLEHYGMERRKLPNGFYEKVTPMHSWNASQQISNIFLFQLQRHSDHHWFAAKRYQVLDHHEDSPQLPAGYSAMILVALVPPLWFSWMNPRLEKWKKIQSESLIQ